MAKHRTHSTEFKRQVVQEYLSGETLHGLANRHDLSRNLIRIWVEKYQAGGLDEECFAMGLLSEDRHGGQLRCCGLSGARGPLQCTQPGAGLRSAMAAPRAASVSRASIERLKA